MQTYRRKTIEQLKRELDQANARCDRAESDGEFEACRELAVYARSIYEAAVENAGRHR